MRTAVVIGAWLFTSLLSILYEVDPSYLCMLWVIFTYVEVVKK